MLLFKYTLPSTVQVHSKLCSGQRGSTTETAHWSPASRPSSTNLPPTSGLGPKWGKMAQISVALACIKKVLRSSGLNIRMKFLSPLDQNYFCKQNITLLQIIGTFLLCPNSGIGTRGGGENAEPYSFHFSKAKWPPCSPLELAEHLCLCSKSDPLACFCRHQSPS